MTVFRRCLDQILNDLEGAVAATLMGVDGLAVDSVAREDLSAGNGTMVELDALIIEYSSLLQEVQRRAHIFAAGGLEELTIRAENVATIIRPVTREYFVALSMRPNASMGKARYVLKLHAPSIIEELQ
jgi:predicted regulator of Ras-like GTPase activity (Roadblock/LC7/MglB family)